jgi:hypothetical protein
MDFRFADGGRDGGLALVAFSTVIGKMEFMPMDVFIEAGQSITITLTQTGEDYVPSPASIGGYTINWAGATMTLPTVNRTCDDLFQAPIHEYGESSARFC